jgi:23S rRNA (guanosine2251-2'-O)-methyltransferase
VAAVLAHRPQQVEELVVSSSSHGRRREEIIAAARGQGLHVRELPVRAIAELTRSESHQGLAALAPLPAYVELEKLSARSEGLIVALDGITDPMNLGAIIRTAEALGAAGVVIPRDRSVALTPAVHKASAGAVEFLPVCRVVNLARTLQALKEDGYWIYAADPGGDEAGKVTYADKSVLVAGAEGSGLRPGVLKEADVRPRIPQAGKTASLNVSAACAILIFDILKGTSS